MPGRRSRSNEVSRSHSSGSGEPQQHRIADIELAGHAVLTLHLAASEPDAALHVFLSEEEPDGTVRYVTEGVLRALHRKLSACPPDYRASWPYHSCDRADAAPLVPGRPEEIVIALLPTAWRFGKGSRIRLAIAGTDADHYGQVPHGRPPVFTIGREGSFLDLPRSPRWLRNRSRGSCRAVQAEFAILVGRSPSPVKTARCRAAECLWQPGTAAPAVRYPPLRARRACAICS